MTATLALLGITTSDTSNELPRAPEPGSLLDTLLPLARRTGEFVLAGRGGKRRTIALAHLSTLNQPTETAEA